MRAHADPETRAHCLHITRTQQQHAAACIATRTQNPSEQLSELVLHRVSISLSRCSF